MGWLLACLNVKFEAFPTTKPYLTPANHSVGSFSNTKGIGIAFSGSLNGKFEAFPPTKPNLTLTKYSHEFATQGYL